MIRKEFDKKKKKEKKRLETVTYEYARSFTLTQHT